MKARIALAASVASLIPLTLCACPPKPPLPPEPDVVIFPPYDSGEAAATQPERCSDGSTVPVDCRLACESLAKIGCPESVPAGRSCGCVCAAAEASSVPMKTLCVANASTPDQMRACNVRCAGR